MTTEWYITDPDDPEAPVSVECVTVPNGLLTVGDTVLYHNPAGPGLSGRHVLSALYFLPPLNDGAGYYSAILNDGEYECNAENLMRAPLACVFCNGVYVHDEDCTRDQ